MKFGVPKETRSGERRVAAVPETVRKLSERGAQFVIESGAGLAAAVPDQAYADAGATVVADNTPWEADVVLKVRPPTPEEIARMRSGAIVVSFLTAEATPEIVQALVNQGVTALAMEAIPRIARAQKMDALSAMANIAGYKAVLEAANDFGRYFPLLMTAAGTVTPAHVLVIGAGVAGLSSIATAHRLGAVVRAFDPRPPVREQVESLGAKFIELDLEAIEETAGGYAGTQSDAFLERERELLASHVADVDVIITTAVIPGQDAPVLITDEMVKSMRPGSVIVDLAAERGGNCALTRADEAVEAHGVKILGYTDLPSRMADQSSALYARTMMNLLLEAWDEDGVAIDLTDEIVGAVAVVHAGADRRSSPTGAAEPETPVESTTGAEA
jgi:NAD(P) transhydrogenase subunit alpha